MAPFEPKTWVDEDFAGPGDPALEAAEMNRIEQGIAGAVPSEGGTMSGPLVIEDQPSDYGLDVQDIHVRDGGIHVGDGGITVDTDWVSIGSGNNGGLLVWGGFEVYHNPGTMPNRAIGFWRDNDPLMAVEDHEPVTKAFFDANAATRDYVDAAVARATRMLRPRSGWDRGDIVAWLLLQGVALSEEAQEQLTVEELLSLVADLMDAERPED